MHKHLKIAAVSAAMAFAATSAQAVEYVQVGSKAFGIFSDVKVINTVGVTVGPAAQVSGQTSPGYNNTGTLASLNTNVDLGLVSLVTAGLGLTTGVINTSATANGTLPTNTSTGSGYSEVNNLGINLYTSTFGLVTTALGLTSDKVTSTTTVTRLNGVNTLTGSSLLANLNLSVLGAPILSLGANGTVGINTVAYDLAGLRILLNEQISTNSGATQSLTTNAIHIFFNNFLLSGRTLTGNIIVGQSFAQINVDPVPEPMTWTQMLAGFALVGSALRRRRQLPA